MASESCSDANWNQLAHEYRDVGHIVVRQFLPAEEFQELRQQIDRYIAEVVPRLPDTHAFFQDRQRPETLKQMQHMGTDPWFEAYTRHPRWVELAAALLGEPASAKSPEWFNKPAGTEHPTPPHQDNYYFCLRPPQVLTMWLALDPVDEQNGCLRYVSGSHKAGLRSHGATEVLGFSQGITDYGPEDTEKEVAMILEAGDLVVHHGETIHRADPNRTTDRPRRSFAMVFQGESAQRDPEAWRNYLDNMARQHAAMGLKGATVS
ncbi:MAG: phytanoyl-CoA dioxygenase family protein [Planctomycetaceae bacterium]|nr:phytanoyl-CoA dioxygenase family protein [Planctomycetaceae bacterium]